MSKIAWCVSIFRKKSLTSSVFININIEWGPQENYLTGLLVTLKTALVLMIDLKVKEME